MVEAASMLAPRVPARREGGNRPLWLSIRGRARNRSRCARRSAGDAFGRADRAVVARVVSKAVAHD